MNQPLIPRHGGYRRLRTYQRAELIYDVTVRFCDAYIGKRSRTHDQMVQAARSGAANIAEGSEASGTSSETEMRLTKVASASLEELRLDYQRFLRAGGYSEWPWADRRRKALLDQRCRTADEFVRWVRDVRLAEIREAKDGAGTVSAIPEIAANAVLVLIGVTIVLLDRQLAAQARRFVADGGFRERAQQLRRQQRA